jgi:hypothetical protein
MTTRAFTVVVTGCSDCPYASRKIDVCRLASLFKWGIVYKQNKHAITPTCLMWNEAKPWEN